MYVGYYFWYDFVGKTFTLNHPNHPNFIDWLLAWRKQCMFETFFLLLKYCATLNLKKSWTLYLNRLKNKKVYPGFIKGFMTILRFRFFDNFNQMVKHNICCFYINKLNCDRLITHMDLDIRINTYINDVKHPVRYFYAFLNHLLKETYMSGRACITFRF